MRVVQIPDCEYKDYEAIRDAIYENMPFALNELGYSPKKKIGIFVFHDTCYIPENLMKFVMSIGGNEGLVKKVNFAIRDLSVAIRD